MLQVNFNPFPVIETERLILRRTILEDTDEFFSIRSHIEGMKFVPHLLHTNPEETKLLILKINEMINFNDSIGWAVCLKNQNKMIGSVSLHRIEKPHYRAEIGYILHPDFWKMGITTEAVKAVINFGFNDIKLHSIEAQIDPTNLASLKVLQHFNFEKEGYFKENFFYNGAFLDTAIFSLINPINYKI